mgnify:CR=1 FL=1
MSIDWILCFALLGSVAFLSVYALIYLPVQTRRDFRRMLSAFARTVEIRELHTSGCAHWRAHYAVQIAQRLRLPTPTIQSIEAAALLLEIGKVGIPYAILNKQAALTVEEAEVLKLHTVIGQRILEQVEWTRRLAPFIRHHHENWDGSGYPDGLQREEIPLASRILHVVDDFTATMRGKQLDNVALHWQAVQQMEHYVGRKYDPRVFEVFRTIVRKEVFERINSCHLSDA